MQSTVHGKSGYINKVSCLSGYLIFEDRPKDNPGRVVAFAMMFNDFKPPVYGHHLKRVQDRFVRLIDKIAARENQLVTGN